MKEDTEIQFYKCHESIPFNYSELPVAHYSEYHPYQGTFDQTGVFIIKNGTSYSNFGYIHSNNYLIKEFLPTNYLPTYHQDIISHQINLDNITPKKIPGRVATLTRIDYDCYGHWIGEFLGRLHLMTIHNITYDWLYVPYDKPYIKETLTLLGIDHNKIIQPFGEYAHIEAEELIIPSLTARMLPTDQYVFHPCVMYCPLWNINWLRTTFLPIAHNNKSQQNFSKKVFISRHDATQRKMLNEELVFSYFEKKGFKRYNLSQLSFIEQVQLFHQAEYIIAAHGSALTNIIFCQPNTCIIEIFQNQYDSTFWQLSESLNLNHHCIETQEPTHDSIKSNTIVSLKKIKIYLKQHNLLQNT
tara:strand:+ start:273 stop:1343 length:1071 start_codon:yes stop_codon:yes gene_type:complete